ncbi:MAG TPA: hypothetical protein VGK19_08845 [Capsulimonadaceae bacterium]|jgi:hypothetical protein
MANDELDQYFEHDTRADEWRALRIALTGRLKALRSAQDATDNIAEQARLEREIVNLRKQVDALLIEEVSQQFVEDSVRVTIAVQQLDEASDGEDGDRDE